MENDYPGLKPQRLLEEYCDYDNSNSEDKFFMENPGFFEKLKLGTPLEYINFKKFFYTNEFYVNKDVLIPRSETEILVEKAIELINKSSSSELLNIIDIGCGSGIIGLTVASEVKRPLKITCSDISLDALEVAKINFENLKEKFHPETEIKFLLMDRLDKTKETYNLILSNPPYIKENGDRKNVHTQTDLFEPHLALFLKDDEYTEWFDIFFKQVKDHLALSGTFLMEGHEDHLLSLKELGEKYFSNINIINDYTQRHRFLECTF